MGSIFQGTPQAATSYTTQSTETPKWMQDAIYNQVQWAQNIANKPYESYDLPTVADLSPLQQRAYAGIEDRQGAGKAQLDKASAGMEGMTTAGTADRLRGEQAQYLRQDLVGANLDAGQDLFDRAGRISPMESSQAALNKASQLDVIGSAQPLLTEAAGSARDIVGAGKGYLTDAAAMSGLNAANPYLNQSQTTTAETLAERALTAANPYLTSASQTAVTDVADYMNPYQQNVLDTIAAQGTRNLTENLLPGVQDAFIKAGQFGSRGMGEFGSRALRDTQEAILRQQAPVAAQGYAEALRASQADKARQAQLAGTVGSISGADLSRGLQGAGQYAQLGQTAGQLTGQDAARLAGIGKDLSGITGTQASALSNIAGQTGQLTDAQMRNLANLGQTQAQVASSEMQNLANLGQTRTQAGAQQQQFGLEAASTAQQAEAADMRRQMDALGSLANLAAQEQSMAYTDLAALEAAGQAQQRQLQTQLSAAEKEYLDAQLYPQRQMDWLSSQVRGLAPILPQQQTTAQSTTGGTYSPSPLSQVATGLATYKGLTS